MANATNQSGDEAAKLPADLPLEAEAARELLNHLSAGVIKVSREGHLLYINPRARRILESNQIPIVGSSLRDFEAYTIWPDGRSCPFEDFPPIKCLRTGERRTGEVVGIRLPSDRVLWLGVTAEPILDPRTGLAEAAVATIIESPEPQHVAAALRHSEERYRRLIENAPDSIVVHHGGTIVFINEAGIRLWAGRSREDFIGRNVLSFIHPTDRAEAAKRIDVAMSGRVTPLIVQRHKRLDGRSIYVEVTGTSCIYDGRPCVQVIFRDVTKRRRTERLVRRQREILRVFFQRIPVIVGIFDAQGNTKAVNREWKRVIGWGAEYSMAELAERIYPDSAEARHALDYALEAAPGWRLFHSRVRGGGIRELMWANIKLSSGDVIGMALDVTEQRAAEAALVTAKEQLEERVRQRTEELTRKNHELRQRQRFLERTLAVQERDRKLVAYEIHDTILQEVIGALMYVDTLHDSDEPDLDVRRVNLLQVRQLLRRCIEEARQMISGLRPPIIDEQGVSGAVDYLVSEMNSRGMNVRFHHEMSGERLEADLEAAVFRIVQEALTNVERHSHSKRAEVSITRRGDRIVVSVRDFGVGFDPNAIHERHFGLEGISERAKLLGGEAKIDSRPGEGTEVRVDLPLTLPKPADPEGVE